MPSFLFPRLLKGWTEKGIRKSTGSVLWGVAGYSLGDKKPKFRGRFFLPFQDIKNMEKTCSLGTLEHVYQRVQYHILEDYNLIFHPSKDRSPDKGKTWFLVNIPQSFRKSRLPIPLNPFLIYWAASPCNPTTITTISEYTVEQLVEALHIKQKVGGSNPVGVIIIFH